MDLTPRTFALATGAAARLWRLLAIDDAGQPVRDLRDRALLAYLGRARDVPRAEARVQTVLDGWKCPYCLGWWISAGVFASGAAAGRTRAWQFTAGALALNYVQASLNAWLDVAPREDEDEDEETPDEQQA